MLGKHVGRSADQRARLRGGRRRQLRVPSRRCTGTDPVCVPVAERAGRELGCFIVASLPVGKLRGIPQYWYLDSFRLEGRRNGNCRGLAGRWSKRPERSGCSPLRPGAGRLSGGERIAEVGPLRGGPGRRSTRPCSWKRSFIPGMKSSCPSPLRSRGLVCHRRRAMSSRPPKARHRGAGRRERHSSQVGPPMQLTGIGLGQTSPRWCSSFTIPRRPPIDSGERLDAHGGVHEA